ncbi:hypothetical protein [Actinospica robiniae]|uniref:hypothetical protein n=1 Tax=Actinospica robiniae TaxID=304901 RepID=UPI000429F8F7|nr:hypothetical protein [Actinospica robiniae]
MSACTATQVLSDRGFENGNSVTPWVETSQSGSLPITKAGGQSPHGGSWMARFNGNGTNKGKSTLAQTVTIPSGCDATVSFWLHIDSTENTKTAKPDTFTVQPLNSSGTVLTTLATFSNLDAAAGYTQHSYDISSYAGQAVTLKFTGTEKDSKGGTTTFVEDDNAIRTS